MPFKMERQLGQTKTKDAIIKKMIYGEYCGSEKIFCHLISRESHQLIQMTFTHFIQKK